jgi:type I restriction enzyme R subunit
MSEDLKPYRYEPIALSNESTVVAEFLPEFPGIREAAYQSEAELEKAFIQQLQAQAYEYLPIASEAELIANLLFAATMHSKQDTGLGKYIVLS